MFKSLIKKNIILPLVFIIGTLLLFWQPAIAIPLLIIGAIAINQKRKKKRKTPFQVEWLYKEIIDPDIRLDNDEKILALDENVKLYEKNKYNVGKLYISTKEVGFIGNTKIQTVKFSNIVTISCSVGGNLKIGIKDRSAYIILKLTSKERAALYKALVDNIDKIKIQTDQKISITVFPE